MELVKPIVENMLKLENGMVMYDSFYEEKVVVAKLTRMRGGGGGVPTDPHPSRPDCSGNWYPYLGDKGSTSASWSSCKKSTKTCSGWIHATQTTENAPIVRKVANAEWVLRGPKSINKRPPPPPPPPRKPVAPNHAKEVVDYWKGVWNEKGNYNLSQKSERQKWGRGPSPNRRLKDQLRNGHGRWQWRGGSNWRAPGPDKIHGIWLKKFLGMSGVLRDSLLEVYEGNTEL